MLALAPHHDSLLQQLEPFKSERLLSLYASSRFIKAQNSAPPRRSAHPQKLLTVFLMLECPMIRFVAFTVEDSSDLCEICREKNAMYTCKLCGRRVCSDDWRGEHCSVCEATLCQVCLNRLSVGYCAVCGRLVCENCSLEIGAARVCEQCASKLGRIREGERSHSR